ncbi:DUF3168 domain-containing protein [Aestuariicella hydrocarbonica]|uniref:DUF3168 domain-containing protein n=1 Tax=Pseudomaricurvus hydrocarbonicus TaxID=1470433 RepID=A0A9E5JU56_9GAMM|nr:DUF3168 domain-containing protein [Aestuariicella hydrocarbonica]NHO64620.1 DUF3168 domain-containing protein [Aestuariicella hydrocarbonica]
MYPPIFAICSVDAGVQAQLGSDQCRLYPFGLAPQGVTKPYAVWQQVSGGPENYINQRPDMDLFSIQVDCWATSADEARAVAQALRDAIEPHAHITAWYGDRRDPETKNYSYAFAVDWFTPR